MYNNQSSNANNNHRRFAAFFFFFFFFVGVFFTFLGSLGSGISSSSGKASEVGLSWVGVRVSLRCFRGGRISLDSSSNVGTYTYALSKALFGSSNKPQEQQRLAHWPSLGFAMIHARTGLGRLTFASLWRLRNGQFIL
jgi:hypothetical protein